MCFSPEADVVGGLVVGGFGIDAVRHVHRRHGALALACLPLVLGGHQLVEAFVWWSLEGDLPHAVGRVATWCYLLIAFVLLPVFVPLAVASLEHGRWRRRVMAGCAGLGAVVAMTLLAAMVRGPVTVRLRPYHLAYGLRLQDGFAVVVAYVIAVCGALLASSERHVVVFGIVNAVAIGVIAWLTVDGFASVWCGWAAITSGAIAAHLRFSRPHRHPPHAPHALT
jgi:hypothetical protein